MGNMEKRMLIAIFVAIGVVAGGFTGYGVFYAIKPAPLPAPITYTLTIVNYKGTYVNEWINCTPAVIGTNYTDGLARQCINYTYTENTAVLIMANKDAYGFNHVSTWTNATGVGWISGHLVWVLMNCSKYMV